MYALISEALLLCPEDEDVVCHHSDEDENDGNPALKAKGMHGENVSAQRTKGTVLVKAKDRVEYAQSYYDMARVGLEEVLCRYGKMAASKVDVGNEKEDIGYLVMSVVGVGNSLSEQQQ
jgi:septum formation topological specificity factor MinE